MPTGSVPGVHDVAVPQAVVCPHHCFAAGVQARVEGLYFALESAAKVTTNTTIRKSLLKLAMITL